ncbi:MAG TPA: hypothetical protein VEB18_01050 [Candidatus Paceibacterota bacterium]|nr:hypothetical protein [Candidatus Paceibacterota bacterium]
MLRLIVGILFIGVMTPSFASAQVSTDPLTINISPNYPRPYEMVTVTVSSNAIDLAASTITISANGSVVEEGLRSTQIKMGGPGTRTTISVNAQGAEGTFTKQATIAPADVSVIVEPIATNHPLYKGASLVPSEGSVRIVALADIRTAPGTRVPNEQIVYTWKLGTQILEAESGLGKNVLRASAPPQYRDATITVTATTQSKSISAQTTVNISPVDPIVRIYRTDPLEGIDFDHALSGTFTLAGAEETFRALPFFFKNTPTLQWTLNGNRSGTGPDVTVRSTGGSGTALLGITATGPEARAETSLTLRFSSGSTGIFGR